MVRHISTTTALLILSLSFVWTAAADGVVINEVHFDPDIKTKFIELINPQFLNSKGANWRYSNGSPTPSTIHSTYGANAAPVMRQVNHGPTSPVNGEAVTVTDTGGAERFLPLQ